MSSIRVSRILIRNVMGIEELDVEPGALSVVSGANGSGKTSVLEAVKSAFGGGHDATLIRKGAEKGEVVVLLSDGTEIAKRISANGSSVTVTHPELGEVKKPQGFLNGLLDSLAFNPVEFITAGREQRVEHLLKSLPLEARTEELRACVGDLYPVELAPKGHALVVIEMVSNSLYDERTGVNRDARSKRTTAAELGGSLPDDDQDVASLRAQYADASKRSAEHAQARDERLRAIRDVRDKEIEAIRRDMEAALNDVRVKAEGEVQAYNETADAARTDIDQCLASLRARIAEAERTANTRSVVTKLQDEASTLQDRSAALTGAMERLQEMKARLLSELPIPGVELVGGEIHQDGVPWPRLNTAARVRLALTLAGLRARAAGLPLVCMDGLECLDDKTFAAFAEKAPKAGLQLVVTRVGDGELSVESIPAAEVRL